MMALAEASLAETPFEAARRTMLVMAAADRRPYMKVAYDVFAGNASEEDLAAVGHAGGSGSAPEFYAQLYLGLYNEALAEGGGASSVPPGKKADTGKAGKAGTGSAVGTAPLVSSYRTKARSYLAAAAASSYGISSNDYMWSLAKVHLQERGW